MYYQTLWQCLIWRLKAVRQRLLQRHRADLHTSRNKLVSYKAAEDLLAAIIQVGAIKLYGCVLCVLIGMAYRIEIVSLRLRHSVQYSVEHRK